MNTQTITIEKMAFGGSGLGYVDGKVCFIPFTVPGDTVRFRVRSEKRSYLEGELTEVVVPSPLRVTPPCPVFGTCGGCNWQHISYAAQTEAKQEIFADLLWRSARVERERILPAVSAPEPYGYRSRVQFKLRYISGQLHLGFYRGGSHFVIDIPQRCAIAHPVINRLFLELHGFMRRFPEPDKVPQIDVTIGDDDAAILVFHYLGSRHDEIVDCLGKLDPGAAAGLYLQRGRKSTLEKIAGIDTLSYRVPENFLKGNPETTLTFAAGGFSQVNYRQNLALIATVFDWAGLTGTEKVLDLYCGNGNFSIPLAHRSASVIGIEEYPPSITDAQRNCAANGIKNALYRCADAVAGVRELSDSGERFDVVIIDPPRTGAAELVRQIPSLHPEKILYVSCDPATLARDIGILRKLGYEVMTALPVDMFPQTYHIESVTLLKPAREPA